MKILLAVDDSKFSELAVDACCKFINAGLVESVKIVSVYEPQVPIASEPVMVSSSYYAELNGLNEDHTEAVAASAVNQLRAGAPDVPVEVTTSVELGQPATVILENAKRWSPDLIIVGSHGRGFWGRLALGSVSDAVVHNAPCAVLIARPQQVTAKEERV